MLYPYNEYLLKYDVKVKHAQYLYEAQADHLVSQHYPRRPGWLAKQIRRALQNLGHVLVAVGRRLDIRSA